VARGIGFADVRLDLDDHAGRDRRALLVYEHLPEEIRRDVQRRAIVERARYDCRNPSRTMKK
jgi:hypothetical protein